VKLSPKKSFLKWWKVCT